MRKRLVAGTTISALALHPGNELYAAHESRVYRYSTGGVLLNTIDLGAGVIISGVGVDPTGAVYLAGNTTSKNLPKPRGNLNGPSDAFLAKLTGDGTDIEWSAYFGGSGADAVTCMFAGRDGALAVAGFTSSPDLAGLSG